MGCANSVPKKDMYSGYRMGRPVQHVAPQLKQDGFPSKNGVGEIIIIRHHFLNYL